MSTDQKWGENESFFIQNSLLIFLVDHIYVLIKESELKINRDEAKSVEWLDKKSLQKLIIDDPLSFSPWFRIIYRLFLNGKKSFWKNLKTWQSN